MLCDGRFGCAFGREARHEGKLKALQETSDTLMSFRSRHRRPRHSI
jgi:hypothetical protein